MNFKQKIMCLSLLGLISQSVLGTDLLQEVGRSLYEEATTPVACEVPYGAVFPYLYGSAVVSAVGGGLKHGYNILAETGSALRGAANFYSDYPKTNTLVLGALLWWLISRGYYPTLWGSGQQTPPASPPANPLGSSSSSDSSASSSIHINVGSPKS